MVKLVGLLVVAIAVAGSGCGGGDDGRPPAPTPMPQGVVAALTDYAIEQGWDLVGPCELHTADDPGFVPFQECYFNAKPTGDGVEIVIGNVSSEGTHYLILQRQPSGSYVVAGDTPLITPATGK